MPRSAIAADAADHVLAVEKMPEVLLSTRSIRTSPWRADAPAVEQVTDDLSGILTLVRTRLHFDFSGYKTGTLVPAGSPSHGAPARRAPAATI